MPQLNPYKHEARAGAQAAARAPMGRQFPMYTLYAAILLALVLLLHGQMARSAWSNEATPDAHAPDTINNEQQSNLQLEKSVEVYAGPGSTLSAAAGETFNPPVDRTTLVTYTLRLAYTGDAESVRAQLVDELPHGVIATGAVEVTAEQGDIDPLNVQVHPKRITWQGTLSQGAVLRVEFGAWAKRCTARPDHELENTAHARIQGGARVQASASFQIPCPPSGGPDEDATPGPDIALHKSGKLERVLNPETNEMEARILWTIAYANLGDMEATGVVIEDRLEGLNLPDYVLDTIVSDDVTVSQEGDALRFSIASVPPGERGRVGIITLLPAVEAVNDTQIVNVATALLAEDVNTENNRDDAKVRIATETPIITSPMDGLTCAGELQVTGTAAPHAEIALYVNDTEQATTTADGKGRWRVALDLPDGTHTLYAVSTLGPLTSLPSASITIQVDSTLLWDPMSLRFSGPRGAHQAALTVDGTAAAEGWQVQLEPATEYTVRLRICCEAGDAAQVTLQLEGQEPIVLSPQEKRSGEEADSSDHNKPDQGLYYTGRFTTPPGEEPQTLSVQLVVQCGDATNTSNGTAIIGMGQGLVLDRHTGLPVEGATVTLLQIPHRRSVEHGKPGDHGYNQGYGGHNYGLRPWDGEPYDQENPQITGADGRYLFAPPPGLYQIVVTKPGYQRYRSGAFRVNEGPIQKQIGLTPHFGGQPAHIFGLGKGKGNHAPMRMLPGSLLKWDNTDTVDHALRIVFGAEGRPAQMEIAQTALTWESGLIAPGESYELALEAEGRYLIYSALDPDPIAEIVVTSETDTLSGRPLYAPFMATE